MRFILRRSRTESAGNADGTPPSPGSGRGSRIARLTSTQRVFAVAVPFSAAPNCPSDSPACRERPGSAAGLARHSRPNRRCSSTRSRRAFPPSAPPPARPPTRRPRRAPRGQAVSRTPPPAFPAAGPAVACPRVLRQGPKSFPWGRKRLPRGWPASVLAACSSSRYRPPASGPLARAPATISCAPAEIPDSARAAERTRTTCMRTGTTGCLRDRAATCFPAARFPGQRARRATRGPLRFRLRAKPRRRERKRVRARREQPGFAGPRGQQFGRGPEPSAWLSGIARLFRFLRQRARQNGPGSAAPERNCAVPRETFRLPDASGARAIPPDGWISRSANQPPPFRGGCAARSSGSPAATNALPAN